MYTIILGCLYSPAYSQLKIGIHLGTSISNFSNISDLPRMGVVIGGSCDYYLKNNFILLSGIQFNMKGGNNLWDSYTYSPEMKKTDIFLSYLECPVSLGYEIVIRKNLKIIPNLGFYCSYGILGYGDFTSINFEAEELFRFYQDTWDPFKGTKFKDIGKTELSALSRFDIGGHYGCIIEAYNFRFNLFYDLGMKSLCLENNEVKNRSLQISLGYVF